MHQTILFKAPGHASKAPIVILSAIELGAKSSTPISARVSRALSKAWNWAKCNCTPRRVFAFTFSDTVSIIVTAIVAAVMWWHNLTIADTIEAQESVAYDCLFLLPWGLVWAFRSTKSSMTEEGGEL